MDGELGAGNSADYLSDEVRRGVQRTRRSTGLRGRGDPVEVGSLVRAGVLPGPAAVRSAAGRA